MKNKTISQKKNTESRVSLTATAIALFDFAPSGYFTLDCDGVICKLNHSGARMLGKNRSYLVNRNFKLFVTPDTRTDFNDFFLKIFKSSSKEICEVQFTINGKPSIFVHLEGVVSRDEQNCFVTAFDITEHKISEGKLKRYNEQLRGLVAHLDNIREEERIVLSRDIHDLFGSSLSSLKMYLAILKQNIPHDYLKTHPAIQEWMQSMANLIDDSIGLMRKLIKQLQPEILEELGLVEAIRWYSHEIEQHTGIKFLITVFPREIKMKIKPSIILFRILQEILTNVVQHSKATKVIVYIKKQRKTFLMRVMDNGTGILQDEIDRKDSYGIIGIRERVLHLDGQVNISGTPGKGTTISIEIPVI